MAADEKTNLKMEEINRKEKMEGTVVKTMLAGAIIDVGMETPGILHISQLQKNCKKKRVIR
jgi:ribosomal protein S1